MEERIKKAKAANLYAHCLIQALARAPRQETASGTASAGSTSAGAASATSHERALQQLETLAAAVEAYPDLKSVLTRPSIVPKIALKVFEDFLKKIELDPPVYRLVLIMVEQRRGGIFKQVVKALQLIINVHKGIYPVRLLSAQPLSSDRIREIVAVLEKRFPGKGFIVETHVEPSLIGGFVLEFGHWQLDASLRRHVEALGRFLLA